MSVVFVCDAYLGCGNIWWKLFADFGGWEIPDIPRIPAAAVWLTSCISSSDTVAVLPTLVVWRSLSYFLVS